tara:strand:+ start:160213 stop:160824 length:612 start_codon:yes stop_codon:yes gene_type:complete
MLQYIQIKINKPFKVLNTSVLGTFVFWFIVLAISGCRENAIQEIAQLDQEGVELPISTSKDMMVQFSDSGERKVILRAPVLERFINVGEPPYDLMPEGIRIEFLDSLGKIEAQVISGHAIYYPQIEELILSIDVQVFNTKKDKLNTEHLVWNARTHRVKADNFVKFTTKDEIIYGDGFEANQDLSDYTMNHIKGIISVENEGL